MAMSKAVFKADLKAKLQSILNADHTKAEAAELIAVAVTDSVDAFIRTAVVNVTVTTTGTAAAQTGTGVGTLS